MKTEAIMTAGAETKMNTIGIDENLNRKRIKKLLTIGLTASVITGIGDFLLGYGEETAAGSLADSILSSAPSLADWQLIAGGLLGVLGIFLEGLSFFAIYRLMADAAPRYAHIYRAGIFGYIWLAPVGCHMNVGVYNLAYKYILTGSPEAASHTAKLLLYWFGFPVYILLILFWVPMIAVQFMAFGKGLTPYPAYARWFNLISGMIPALVLAAVLGMDTAAGAAVGTMFLSFGNAFTFGGLLAALPPEERFEEFRAGLSESRDAGKV